MRRRWVLTAGGTGLVLAAAGATALPERTEAAPVPRLLNDASWHAADDGADAAWLAEGVVPGAGGPYEAMVRQGLLDLRALTAASGAVAAGPAPSWRYAWPRDSAFAAVALARTAHPGDADRVLGFLTDVQLDDGGFEARYLLDGGGTPDGRRRQDDGAGWALWALREVLDADPSPASARARAEGVRALLEAATEFVLDRTGGGEELPEPSPDYWERRETRLTLGTAAPLVAGLRAAAAVHSRLGERSRALAVGRAADRLRALVRERFAPSGFARYADLDEPPGGVDAAVAFLLPPFAARAEPDVLAALDRYQVQARRPAGGLAPGAGWRRDGVSWTPETAVVAHVAACSGRTGQARAWLDWLDAHRTSWGSIPEKVLADGSPAGPAPLGWSAAAAVLAVAAL
ncbi:GH15 family glucan-1,4-alpha-glucosidase [Kineococcus radiotolerans]|uniref:GH15 family glucan-1,4-alpha-glucosidase n=1 Tax=Kineococcus radiotolerans TaxID=131568 RepID=A0A7W4TLK4_KINRA|nr:glycoside hydrolase family 15 [Kineococcus radiotolerans]MBB2901161.1 GH15 family glucan-1,4-alpha-glucosidase [Kineococcus radiotolerans]